MNPELDIDTEDRTISAVRARTIYRRRSRRELEKNMTQAMLQAERDIALGWKISNGHMGYGGGDVARVRGGQSTSDENVDHPAARAYHKWRKECPEGYSNITIDIACLASPIPDIAKRRGMNARDVTRNFYAGLCCYCRMMGWPSLTKREFDALLTSTPK